MIHSMLFHSGTITIVRPTDRHVDISCFCRFENDFVSPPFLPSLSSSGARSIITPVISDPAVPPGYAAVGRSAVQEIKANRSPPNPPFCVTL